jgi:hypothetical protein
MRIRQHRAIPAPEPIGGGKNGELVYIEVWPIESIRPAPENDAIYAAIALDDPEVQELSKSIKVHGIQEPILVSRDGYIISGHRRRVAAYLAGLSKVPVRVHPVSRANEPETFTKLLVEMNSQRIKSPSDLMHETLVKLDPADTYKQLRRERAARDRERGGSLEAVDPQHVGRRCELSRAKMPFLAAILKVLEEQREYWPISVRQVHYRLLGPGAPLTHASKPQSRYQNNLKSYASLVDVCARGRVAGLIPWEAIEDTTRPTELNAAFSSPAEFFRQEFRNFLQGYWRGLLQSQPHHVEIVNEKLTVQSILQQVARRYTMPLTTMRGMNTLDPKRRIYLRHLASRKAKLLILGVSDLDPAGDTISEDLAKSFRRDFGIENIEVYKAALTLDQVEQYALEPSMAAKESSPTYRAYVDRRQTRDAYELDALVPSDLAEILDAAILDVIDVDLYNQELAAEQTDSAQILAVRQQADAFFKALKL